MPRKIIEQTVVCLCFDRLENQSSRVEDTEGKIEICVRCES